MNERRNGKKTKKEMNRLRQRFKKITGRNVSDSTEVSRQLRDLDYARNYEQRAHLTLPVNVKWSMKLL